jgi:hypothetical protein
VIVEYTLAKFSECFCFTNALVDVWLHEKGKRLSRDVFTIIARTHADKMGRRP